MREGPSATPASDYLRSLARDLASVYVVEAGARAILLTGSAAEGLADVYSDLDLIVYHDVLPSEDQLARARTKLAAGAFRWLAPPGEDFVAEAYQVRGVECQVGHLLIDAWEQKMKAVLDASDPGSVEHKALGGLLDGMPLHGADLIRGWQRRAAQFPPLLARRMVEHHVAAVFPVWYVSDALASRDATGWLRQTLIESSMHVLGVLAGLNHRYFSAFQLKRTRRFVESLAIAPPHLRQRLETVYRADDAAAVAELEQLVAETLSLAAAHMPEADTTVLRRGPGERYAPWG
jgi:hypothetical protein